VFTNYAYQQIGVAGAFIIVFPLCIGEKEADVCFRVFGIKKDVR
jgi:hypothetical protein